MALTHLDVTVANPDRPEEARTLRFVLDSGADRSVVPREVLEALGIRPRASRTLFPGDLTRLIREEGEALFELEGSAGKSPVLFGEPGDDVVLGKLTLASLGLFLHPFRRELRPLPARA